MPERSGARTGELDVRQVPKPQRHPLIFDRFAALPPAGSFVLVDTWGPDSIMRAPDGERKTIDGADARELEAKGSIRAAGGKSFEVTNEGRARSGG